MTAPQMEIQAIAVLLAAACAVPGVLLVLRRTVLLTDAISHSVLLGIVLAFFLVRDLNSPLLIVAAAATGLATVALVEALRRTRLVREDAAIGLVFPALFSLAVVLISRHAADVHLDTDSVLLGELAFAPFDRLVVNGTDLGPKALYVMTGILALNLAFITGFYKELKLATFDSGFALALGFSPALIHYSLMGVVSVTAVGAFDSVGAILVLAFMVAPASSAYLLADSLGQMLGYSVWLGIVSALGGYWTARILDASIAGSMAGVAGLIFVAVYLFAPERGQVITRGRRRRLKREFARATLAVHLLRHEQLDSAEHESSVEHLKHHFRWDARFATRVIQSAEHDGLLERRQGQLTLTDAGRQLARESVRPT